MVVLVLAVGALLLALIPALLYGVNVCLYRPAPSAVGPLPPVSVLIPARNEERSIAAALEAVLASRGVEIEVVVLDDDSEDETGAIVETFAARDGRVRLISSEPLPAGWCGKQFACAQLARHARHPLLLFVDADVRLADDAVARLVAFRDRSGADLVSGVPRQETGAVLERLVIPLIHVLLLGYLPLIGMRLCRHTAFGAGCGQLFLTRRAAYEVAGGHNAVRGSLHDGIALPRAYRRAGLRTDLCDATDLAVCRMYRGAGELWNGLAKNAHEGMATRKAILPWTLLLLGGHVLPFALLACAPILAATPMNLAALAAIAACSLRLHAAWRFRQSWLGAALHPLGVIVLLAIQWYALLRSEFGRPVGWKGRSRPSPIAQPVEAPGPVFAGQRR